MHIRCAFFVVGLVVAGLTHASSESACGSLSTITVTVTASQVTEAVINAANPSTPVPQDVTTTLSSTNFLTNTKVVTVADAPVPASSQLNAFQDGNYYFAEDSGTTTWLSGKTPTSGAVLVTNTLIVTVQPQPMTETSTIVAASSSEDRTTTSVMTISSTSFYTYYLTKAFSIQSASTPVASARLLPYLGSYGWNATLSTVQRLESQATVLQSSDDYVASDAVWPNPSPVSAAAFYAGKRYHPRQIGAIVTATINGVVVSWTNSCGGETTVSNSVTSIETSSAKTAATPSENVASETSTLPAYTWNLSPVPSKKSVAQPRSSALQASTSLQSSTRAAPSLAGVFAATLKQGSLSIADKPSFIQPSTRISSSTVSLVASIPPFSNTTQTSTAASATASSCGSDAGRFTINFDDLPHFSTTSPLSDIPPIFNPYRKLFFNGGYGYVPPPSDPYAPVSPPQLAVYNYHNDSVSQQSIDAGLELHGEIGAGPGVNESAYWIDAYSTWIGCANAGPSECRIDFIGYDKFDAEIATQTVLQPPCPGLANCKLAEVTFTSQFRDLAGLQILAYVNKTPVTFYMDDLSLGWSNNTCAAQLERSSGE